MKDFGARGDGTADDTTAIQNAVNSICAGGGTLIFPAASRFYAITGGIQLSSCRNIRLQADAGAEIRFKDRTRDAPYIAWPNFGKDSILRIVDSSGITIHGLTLNGNITHRTAHALSESMNSDILVAGSTNITITNCVLQEGMTDGLLLVPDASHAPNKNTRVENNRILNNRRNNISGVGQVGLDITGNTISGAGTIQGTAPQSGIDIEPDYVVAPLSADVHIEGNTVTGSAGKYAISCGGYGTAGLTVSRNSIHDNAGYGVNFDSYSTNFRNTDAMLADNSIFNNSAPGVRVVGRNLDGITGNKIRENAWGVQAFSSDGLRIVDNLFEANLDGGITTGSNAPLGFLNLSIERNVFRDNNSARGVANGAGWALAAVPVSNASVLIFGSNLLYTSALARHRQLGLSIAGTGRFHGNGNTAFNTQGALHTFDGISGSGNHIFSLSGGGLSWLPEETDCAPFISGNRGRTARVNQRRVGFARAHPSSGSSHKGDIVLNSNPANGSPVAWICQAAGTPGSWVALTPEDIPACCDLIYGKSDTPAVTDLCRIK